MLKEKKKQGRLSVFRPHLITWSMCYQSMLYKHCRAGCGFYGPDKQPVVFEQTKFRQKDACNKQNRKKEWSGRTRREIMFSHLGGGGGVLLLGLWQRGGHTRTQRSRSRSLRGEKKRWCLKRLSLRNSQYEHENVLEPELGQNYIQNPQICSTKNTENSLGVTTPSVLSNTAKQPTTFTNQNKTKSAHSPVYYASPCLPFYLGQCPCWVSAYTKGKTEEVPSAISITKVQQCDLSTIHQRGTKIILSQQLKFYTTQNISRVKLYRYFKTDVQITATWAMSSHLDFRSSFTNVLCHLIRTWIHTETEQPVWLTDPTEPKTNATEEFQFYSTWYVLSPAAKRRLFYNCFLSFAFISVFP